MFQYEAEQNDELTLSVGDIITNVDIQDQGWWEGEVKGKRGVFPENFVEVIKEDPLIGKIDIETRSQAAPYTLHSHNLCL